MKENALFKAMVDHVMGDCRHTFIDKNNPDGGGVLPGHKCDRACSKCGEKPDGYNHNSKWRTVTTDVNVALEAITGKCGTTWLGWEHGEYIAKVWAVTGWSRATHPTKPAVALCLAALNSVGIEATFEED